MMPAAGVMARIYTLVVRLSGKKKARVMLRIKISGLLGSIVPLITKSAVFLMMDQR